MRLAMLADEARKEEVLMKQVPEGTELIWAGSVGQLVTERDIDAYFDFEFVLDQERIDLLATCHGRPVFVNSVVHTIEQIGHPFIRFNGWPGFFLRPVTEMACLDKSTRMSAESIFSALHWPIQFIPDTVGMISARVIAMIINEAYFTLQEKISSKEDIDIAMKLGTNYPFGPFEWSRKIGLLRVYELLNALSAKDDIYEVASALKAECGLPT
jgi:3-hydroxybutyryl-CoA dehydrogenase